MIREEDDGLWNVLSETIASHHEDVFEALTTAGGLRSWFSMDAKVELRQGGQIVFCWDKNCTRTSTIAILDYDAGGKIVWDWFAENTSQHAPVYWQVEPSREKGAVVTMRQGPFKDERRREIARFLVHEGPAWGTCPSEHVSADREVHCRRHGC